MAIIELTLLEKIITLKERGFLIKPAPAGEFFAIKDKKRYSLDDALKIVTVSTVLGKDVTKHEKSYNHQDYNEAYKHSEQPHLQFSGLAKITVSSEEPENPLEGDLWIQVI